MVIYGKAFSGGLPLSLLLIDTKYANITSGTALAATYWGYPLAIHVAEHIINRFRKENLLDTLQENSSYFFSQLSRIFQDQGIDFRFEGPSAMPVFVTGENNFLIQTFYQRCFQLGLYFRRPGKNWFVSTSHTQQVLDESLEKFEMAIKKTKKNIPMRRL
jgi:glutamate-1-semialdehyde aminotransferase